MAALVSILFLDLIFDQQSRSLDVFLSGPSNSDFVFFSLRLCAILDHFGYPAPLFSGWQQAQWYSLPKTEAWLRKLRKDILDGHELLPTIGAMLARVPGLGSEANPSPGNRLAPSGSTTPRPRPVVTQKEPRKHPVPPSSVGSTVGLGLGRKPVALLLLGWI